MSKHLVYFIAGFALLVSACQLPDEKEEKSVTNCTEVYEGSEGEQKTRKYCVWNNGTKTLTVYNWKPGTGPSGGVNVSVKKGPIPQNQIDRTQKTITTSKVFPFEKYVFDSDI